MLKHLEQYSGIINNFSVAILGLIAPATSLLLHALGKFGLYSAPIIRNVQCLPPKA